MSLPKVEPSKYMPPSPPGKMTTHFYTPKGDNMEEVLNIFNAIISHSKSQHRPVVEAVQASLENNLHFSLDKMENKLNNKISNDINEFERSNCCSWGHNW